MSLCIIFCRYFIGACLMSREIERKWLWDYDKYPDYMNILKELDFINIKDYYFNDYCRLRNVGNGLWLITIKSEGDLVREEFEYIIDNEQIDFVPVPTLCKKRFIYPYDMFVYEINVFRDIYVGIDLPLITVELEMDSPSLVLTNIPDFCGQDITFIKEFYGYNLFKGLKENTNVGKKYSNNVIPFKAIDKQK